MRFSEIVATIHAEAGRCVARVSDDWTQGRSLFGGLQVILALRAMRSLVPAGVPLRSLQTAFVAPVPPGEVTVAARVLRSGKSATQVEARISNGEETLCLVLGIFGQARSSVVNLLPRQPEVVPQKQVRMPFIPGVTPAFTQHFEVTWLCGDLPFTGSSNPVNVLEVSMRDEGVASEDHVVAIADYIPPIGLSMLKSPSPGSSMTWMLEFLRDRFDDLLLNGWRVDGELQAAHEGYTSQSVTIWAPNGEPVALSRQSMVVFG